MKIVKKVTVELSTEDVFKELTQEYGDRAFDMMLNHFVEEETNWSLHPHTIPIIKWALKQYANLANEGADLSELDELISGVLGKKLEG